MLVVLTNGPARKALVSEVRFIRGDEKLKAAITGLKAADFRLIFPSDAATKVIRRGTLFCQTAGGGCALIMLSPELAVVD